MISLLLGIIQEIVDFIKRTKYSQKIRLALEIGPGKTKAIKNAIGLDIRKTEAVDVIADARFLPFKDEVFDYVYASHVLEHFSYHEVKDVVREWGRVLKRGGVIEIRVPWLRMICLRFIIRPNWGDIRLIYGGQEYPEDFHKCGFSFKLLKEILEECGFKHVKRVVINSPDKHKGIPIIPNCLHVRGLKV